MHLNAKKWPTRNPDGLDDLRAVLDENLGSVDDLEGLDDPDIPDREKRMARIAERVLRIVRHMLIGMNRDYERCGKAACARSRRCRGFACEPAASAVRTAAASRG